MFAQSNDNLAIATIICSCITGLFAAWIGWKQVLLKSQTETKTNDLADKVVEARLKALEAADKAVAVEGKVETVAAKIETVAVDARVAVDKATEAMHATNGIKEELVKASREAAFLQGEKAGVKIEADKAAAAVAKVEPAAEPDAKVANVEIDAENVVVKREPKKP